MNNIRELRQKEGEEAWFDNGRNGVLMAAPRYGKTFVAVNIFKRLDMPVIIAYPRVDIKASWMDTFKKLKYNGDVRFTTFHGLKKLKDMDDHLIVLDELHECSLNQLREVDRLVSTNYILGLSGTITGKTEREILRETGLNICYHYPISQAVKEGVLADYEITVHKVPLDNLQRVYKNKKGDLLTEREEFKRWHWVYENNDKPFFMELKLISLLQNSIAKVNKTIALLDQYKDERVLVFCGQTKIADSLGISAYHSKSKDKEVLDRFCSGNGVDQLACVAMLTAGITIKPIDRGIMNYASGAPERAAQSICRFLGTEMNRPDKVAKIDLITTDQPFDALRVTTALDFFDNHKIKYV